MRQRIQILMGAAITAALFSTQALAVTEAEVVEGVETVTGVLSAFQCISGVLNGDASMCGESNFPKIFEDQYPIKSTVQSTSNPSSTQFVKSIFGALDDSAASFDRAKNLYDAYKIATEQPLTAESQAKLTAEQEAFNISQVNDVFSAANDRFALTAEESGANVNPNAADRATAISGAIRGGDASVVLARNSIINTSTKADIISSSATNAGIEKGKLSAKTAELFRKDSAELRRSTELEVTSAESSRAVLQLVARLQAAQIEAIARSTGEITQAITVMVQQSALTTNMLNMQTQDLVSKQNAQIEAKKAQTNQAILDYKNTIAEAKKAGDDAAETAKRAADGMGTITF